MTIREPVSLVHLTQQLLKSFRPANIAYRGRSNGNGSPICGGVSLRWQAIKRSFLVASSGETSNISYSDVGTFRFCDEGFISSCEFGECEVLSAVVG
jgi:hypothetical protein